MLPIPRNFTRKLLDIKKGVTLNRNYVAYLPPSVRISFTEKMIMFAVQSIIVSAIPAWVLYHIPDYQGTRDKYKKK